MENVIPFLIQHGYAVLFVWVLAETMGLPLPSAPLLVTAGAVAGVGKMNLFLCIGVGVCAALLSDIFWYSMGRQRGGKVLSQLCRISLEPDSCVRRTEDNFSRYGARSLLVTKFLPGLSAVSTPLAGITRMRLPLFLLFDAWECLSTSVHTLLPGIYSAKNLIRRSLMPSEWAKRSLCSWSEGCQFIFFGNIPFADAFYGSSSLRASHRKN